MRFVIDRTKWLRGKGTGILLNEEGCRCCIGFVGSQLGIEDDDLLNIFCLRGVDGIGSMARTCGFVHSSSGGVTDAPFIQMAYELNDDFTLDDAARESKLIELFKANGHELVFEN